MFSSKHNRKYGIKFRNCFIEIPQGAHYLKDLLRYSVEIVVSKIDHIAQCHESNRKLKRIIVDENRVRTHVTCYYKP